MRSTILRPWFAGDILYFLALTPRRLQPYFPPGGDGQWPRTWNAPIHVCPGASAGAPVRSAKMTDCQSQTERDSVQPCSPCMTSAT